MTVDRGFQTAHSPEVLRMRSINSRDDRLGLGTFRLNIVADLVCSPEANLDRIALVETKTPPLSVVTRQGGALPSHQPLNFFDVS